MSQEAAAETAPTPEEVAVIVADAPTLVEQPFFINDPDTANWLVRKIVALRAYRQHVKEWAEKEVRRAEREESQLIFMFGPQIEAWTREEVRKLNGRRKTIFLPAGNVGFRSDKARLVVDDETVVLKWARTNCPNAIVTSERLLITPIKKHFEKTGEMPEEGVHIEPERERFQITG